MYKNIDISDDLIMNLGMYPWDLIGNVLFGNIS